MEWSGATDETCFDIQSVYVAKNYKTYEMFVNDIDVIANIAWINNNN